MACGVYFFNFFLYISSVITIMENKILILLMSCDLPLYESEEQACRETFLKDAESAGIPYYFYRGTEGGNSIDEENHIMLVHSPDNLAGTSQKTVLAFYEALKRDDWDYIVKTNVSTWLDIEKIAKAVSCWEGPEDRNIYGARFLANENSKNTPFPRGHFIILSRSLVEGIVKWGPKLLGADGIPKTDDTLLGLSLLYHEQKIFGEQYLSRLMEVPSVVSWSSSIQEAPDYPSALCIRCKYETEPEKTPDCIRAVHKLKKSKKVKRTFRRPVERIETRYGYITYGDFNTIMKALLEKKEREKEAAKVEYSSGTVRRANGENALEKIREKLGKYLPKE